MRITLILFSLMACLSVKAQTTFADSLRFKISKSIGKIFGYNEFSDIVFIDYDISRKTLMVKTTKETIYTKCLADLLLRDPDLTRFVVDSAKNSFILPIFFWIDHDEKDWKWDIDALLVPRQTILNFFTILNESQKAGKDVFGAMTFGHNYGGRKE